jgi:hypothetical protein
VCICECAARGAENVANAYVLKPLWGYDGKVDRIEVARLLGVDVFCAHR